MFNLGRAIKESGKRLLRLIFELGQYVGVDILPRNFYSEIPVIHQLKKTTHWRAPFSMHGVSGAQLPRQVEFIKECCSSYVVKEIKRISIHSYASQQNGAPGFGRIESDFLFAFIVTHQPKQIFQIGCGVSTAICLKAAEYAEYKPQIICLEPYPTDYLLAEAEKGNIHLIREMAQCYDPENLSSLSNDLLFFVDSTHTLGPMGEVSRIILEMLPRLKKGAWVHFHDIIFPYDYDRNLLTSALFFQHESILLHSFLAYNNRFQIQVSLSMLHYKHPEIMKACLSNYIPAANDDGLEGSEGDFPSSIYLKAI